MRYELTGRMSFGGHRRNLEADRLEVGDRAAELDAFLGIADGMVERGLRQADRAGGRMGARNAEPLRGVLESTAEVGVGPDRRTRALESKFPGLPAEITDLRDRRARAVV